MWKNRKGLMNNYYIKNIPYIVAYAAYLHRKSFKLFFKCLFFFLFFAFVLFKLIINEGSRNIQYLQQEQEQTKSEKQEKEKIEKIIKEREEQIKKDEENKRLNQETLTKSIKQVYPIGTYLKNKNGEVGQVKEVQGEQIFTNWFEFNYTTDRHNITYISYSEYINTYSKQVAKKIKEEQELTPKQKSEMVRQEHKFEQMLKEKFPKSPKYAYCKNTKTNEYYRIKDYSGANLITDNNEKLYGFDKNLINITYMEYEFKKY